MDCSWFEKTSRRIYQQIFSFVRDFFCVFFKSIKENSFLHEKVYHERVYLGTWNVNGRKPEGLNSWLQVSDGNPPDIVAIGYFT